MVVSYVSFHWFRIDLGHAASGCCIRTDPSTGITRGNRPHLSSWAEKRYTRSTAWFVDSFVRCHPFLYTWPWLSMMNYTQLGENPSAVPRTEAVSGICRHYTPMTTRLCQKCGRKYRVLYPSFFQPNLSCCRTGSTHIWRSNMKLDIGPHQETVST